jgi:hypothetical protein
MFFGLVSKDNRDFLERCSASVLDPFDPEDHRPESVRAASEGDTLLLHPGIISAIQDVDKVSLDIREGPVAEIRRAVVAVHNEFLTRAEALALRRDLALIACCRQAVSIDVLHVQPFDDCDFRFWHDTPPFDPISFSSNAHNNILPLIPSLLASRRDGVSPYPSLNSLDNKAPSS